MPGKIVRNTDYLLIEHKSNSSTVACYENCYAKTNIQKRARQNTKCNTKDKTRGRLSLCRTKTVTMKNVKIGSKGKHKEFDLTALAV